MMEKKRALEEQLELTQRRLSNAMKLMALTAGEAVRWAETDKVLASQLENLFGDILLVAATVSYNGPFTGAYRSQLVDS